MKILPKRFWNMKKRFESPSAKIKTPYRSIVSVGFSHLQSPTDLLHSLAMERTATRREFTFEMIKAVSAEAALALGGGRPSWSR